MKHVRLFILMLSTILFSVTTHSQVLSSSGKSINTKNPQQGTKITDRLVFGGGLSGGANNNGFSLGIAPKIGYKITDNFYAGVGFGYFYTHIKNGLLVPNVLYGGSKRVNASFSTINGNIWSQYRLFDFIIFHGEFEVNNWSRYNTGITDHDVDGWGIPKKSRHTVPSLLLGGGINQRVSNNVYFYAVVLYDVLQNVTLDADGNKKSPYKDNVDFRVGISVGF